DDNVASFSDVNSVGQTVTLTDPTAGSIYVAWTSSDTPFANPPSNFSPNRILISASSDGGNNFSGATVVNANGNVGPGRMTNPTLTISQGRAFRAPGTLGPTDPGATAIAGGQVTVGYDDFGTGATATPVPFDLLKGNQVSGAVVDAFQGPGMIIGDAQ